MKEQIPMPSTIKVGLRFDPKDRALLRQLAERAKVADIQGEAVTLFEYAAQAAEAGGLMGLEAESLEEARVVAGVWSRYGVTIPTVEEVRA